MATRARSPWPFLLSALRRSPRPRFSRAEIEAAGIDVEALLEAGLIERAPDGAGWRPPGCEHEHACLPNFDFSSRSADGLVGVACPEDPACWPGFEWFPAAEVESFNGSAIEILGAVGRSNGLQPLVVPDVDDVVLVGLLAARRRQMPVVWMFRSVGPFDATCRGLRACIGGDALVVLVGRARGTVPRLDDGGVIVLDIPSDDDGDLALWRALDLIDPSYRQTRVGDPLAIFDEVRLELATVPGERHIVRINGHELGGFQKSDVKFMRLLYLAAVRAGDHDVEGGGWVKKTKLQDDDKNHETEAVRFELEKGHHPDLTSDELKALLKTSPKRNGTVRLAVRPEKIRFDGSLAQLEFVGEQQTQPTSGKRRRTPGARQLAENLKQGREVAEQLLAAARKLGVPAPAGGRG